MPASAAASKIQPQSVVDTIHARVREEILNGQHLPGSVLRQEDIANRFGVSKIPLREAFSRLQSEGFLTLRPRRGYAVREFSIEEIKEIFNLRAIIEEHGGRLSAEMRTPAQADHVMALSAEMSALDLGAPNYYARWTELNNRFHAAIMQASNRQHVIKMAQQMRDVLLPYVRLYSTMPERSEEVHVEHRQIAAAFQTGDAYLVGALSAAHCYHSRDKLVANVQRAFASDAGAATSSLALPLAPPKGRRKGI
jgi:DNA-binding GntR family transcriptional regulator